MRLSRFVAVALLPAALMAQNQDWVKRSNEHAQVLLSVLAKFAPEGAGQLGVRGLDEEVSQIGEKRRQESLQATRDAAQELRKRLAAEKDPIVKQDLQILIDAADRQARASEASYKKMLPYFSVPQTVFGGEKALLDDQVEASRRQAAVVRLKKYTGLQQGYTPLIEQAEQYWRERVKDSSLLGPPRAEVEKDLANTESFMTGIGVLLEKYKVSDYSAAYAKLREQVASYNDFVKKEVLPRSRDDFRLPPELYKQALENFGVDIAPEELTAKAHKAFTEIQAEMQKAAAEVAKEHGWSFTDYRDVIRELKKKQLGAADIMPHYHARLKEIEGIVQKQNLVSLPKREAIIRLATEAETAAQPAPHMQPPPLIGNKGERGQFVLPLNNPSPDGKQNAYDDFTFEAASWSLTSHEARPGHEMQFAAMVERGVSIARAVFAFNSANVEGWGLYSEYIMRPYMTAEGRLVSLNFLLLRAGRAYLDPELQMGKIKPEQAMKVLKEDEMQSEGMATQEVERYTFRMPGQATSYFYGYTRLLEIRKELEQKLGAKFDQKRFHDFVLSQGLLPPDLLRKAVMEEFLGKS